MLPSTFWERVRQEGDDPVTGCWLWVGPVQHGYGSFNSQRSHRLSYEEMRAPIPEGLVIDHLCRVKNCVNPEHLDPVPQRVNVLRGMAPRVCGAANAAKTHCPSGHEYTPENTNHFRNMRRCRTCQRERMRARRAGS